MFIAEELLNEEGIKDLMTRDADAPIFSRLGLKYGKAVRFKAEFAKFFLNKRSSLEKRHHLQMLHVNHEWRT